MVSPQPTDAHIRIAHSIEEEIMMRDFTKRQRSIMDFVLRLSWGCGKKTALIPMQKDFELVGIDQTKARAEIDWLVNAKVISRDPSGREYAFNKNFDEWRVSIVPGYNKTRFNELLALNIHTCQNGKSLAEKASENETGLDEKASEDLTKKQVQQGENPEDSRSTGPPKEIIINTTTTTDDDNGLAKTASDTVKTDRLPGAPVEKESDRLLGASDEPHAVEEIGNHYFLKTGRLANAKDFVSITEVLDRPLAVPLDYKSRIEIINQTMDRIAGNKPKDSIKSFSYFKDGIIDDFKKIEIASNPRVIDETKSKKPFQQNNVVNKGNFEQRKYSDEDFEKIYKDV